MNKPQKILIHFSAALFITFIMVFFMNTLTLINGFQSFFELGQKVELTVFVYDGVEEDKIQNFIKRYSEEPKVTSLQRQTAEQAFESLKAELKLFDFQMSAGDVVKVLPQVITMQLKSLDKKLISEIKSNPIVDELMDGRHWLQKNENIIAVLKTSAVFVSFVCISSLILALTLLLRTQIQFEKDEIYLRAMHGQTLWSLRRRYMLKGAVFNFLGALLGILSVFFFVALMKDKVLTQFQIQTLVEQIQTPSWSTSFMVLISSAIMGALVSLWQTSKFEKMFFLQR